jgi:hypothetical protein
MNWPLNGPEDGTLGGLIVALVWFIVEWLKKRSHKEPQAR